MFNSPGSGNDFSSKMGNSKIIKSLLDCLQAILLFNFIIFVTAWILSQRDRSVIVFISLSAMFSFFASCLSTAVIVLILFFAPSMLLVHNKQ